MKKWNTPVITELNLSNTEHGSSDSPIHDYIFKDQNGWIFTSSSGTGLESDNRKDVVDPPVTP